MLVDWGTFMAVPDLIIRQNSHTADAHHECKSYAR